MATIEWAEGAKMPLIECEQSPGSVSLRQNDCTEIRQPSIQVVVLTLEVRHGSMAASVEADDGEPASRKIIEKGQPGRSAHPLTKEVVDLRGSWGWDDQFARLSLEHFLHPCLPVIPPVGQRDKRSRVDHQRHSPKPASSSSSGTSAIEPPGPSPTRLSAKLRFPRCSGT